MAISENKNKTIRSRIAPAILLLIGAVVTFLLLATNLPDSPALDWRARRNEGPPLKLKRPRQRAGTDVPLCEKMTVENWYTERNCMVLYFSISAKPRQNTRETLKALRKRHDSEIKDDIRTIVGSLSLAQAQDPQLAFVKNSVRDSVQKVVGEGLVDDILVPTWHCFML